MDHLVQPVHRLAEAFAGSLARQVRRGPQAEPDLEQVLDHPVEQLAGQLGLAGCDASGQVREILPLTGLSGVADHREHVAFGSSRHRAEADLDGERSPVFALSGQPRPLGHRPGLRRAVVICAVAGVGGAHLGRDELVNRQAGHFLPPVAEHLGAAPVDQGDPPVLAGQRQAVSQRVEQLPEHSRGHGPDTAGTGQAGLRRRSGPDSAGIALPAAIAASSRG